MPAVSPCNCRLSKKINRSLLVAVAYAEVADHPESLDVTIEFTNTNNSSDSNSPSGTPDAEDSNASAEATNEGWFRSLWAGEKAPLAPAPLADIPLFLGYVQMMGYVRVNRQIGGDGTLDAATNVYWKNLEYLENYLGKSDDVYDEIYETPFFKDHGSDSPRKARIGGINDLKLRRFDHTAVYLLHDLAHTFNTMQMPDQNAPPLPEPYHQALADDLSSCIVPFYVTAQHLLFSSVRLPGKLTEIHKIRMPRPPGTLPPSYNTRLAGAAGDGGAVSICYSLIVGLLEPLSESMKPRAVYFPMELKPGRRGWDRGWLQRDFLQDTLVDKDWKPQTLEAGSGGVVNGANGADESNGKNDANGTNGTGTSEKKFIRDLDTLIESSVHVVAANERRKSSVSLQALEQTGYIHQVPQKLKVLYQIRVNSQSLCKLTVSKPFYHVGDDIHFFLELFTDSGVSTRVVGAITHVEAHEVFNLESDTNRKSVNFYKVTPTVKLNTYADAMADAYHQNSNGVVTGVVNLPRFLTQQFQLSTFMDLKYFLVCRFVLNDFEESEGLGTIDADPNRYLDYIQEYKVESKSSEFKFLIPMTVLP